MKISYIINKKKYNLLLNSVKKLLVKDFLVKISLNSEDYLVSKNDEILLDDDDIFDKDVLKLHKVWSGG